MSTCRRRMMAAAATTMIMIGGVTGWLGIRGLHPDSSSGTPPPTSVSSPQAMPAHDGRNITLLAAGDVLLHPELWDQARRDGGGDSFDFYPMFAHAAASISTADLAICHLETPLATSGGPYAGFPRFSVPPHIADGLRRAGFDACSTASNHSIDQSDAGVVSTIEELERVGLGHSGTYRSAAEALKPTVYDVRGVKVGHLSYTKHLNGLTEPPGKEWLINQIDVTAIVTAAKMARTAGAEIVVLSLHWGTEYQHEPDANQQALANQLAASPDIDLIFGHHAHVVQPIEKVSGKWVAFGLGNQIARHQKPVNDNREGAMMRVRFSQDDDGRWSVSLVEVLPIWVDLNPDIRLIDLAKAVTDPTVPDSKKAIYAAALDRIHAHLISRGAQEDGLTVVGANSK